MPKQRKDATMILMALSTSLMAFVAGWWILSVPLLWLLLIVGIVFLVRSRGGRPPWTGGGRETGIDVLERRFAEGELSLEQYRERRSVLEEKR
jgi:putative membrane protein